MASANEEPHYPIRTLASTKSLRPKPYKRPTILSNVELEDEEIFLNRSIKTLQTGTFLQIHTKCQLDKHERLVFEHFCSYLDFHSSTYLNIQSSLQARQTQ